MLELDGKPIDLTKPQTWGDSIKIKPNGYIEQTKDGVIGNTGTNGSRSGSSRTQNGSLEMVERTGVVGTIRSGLMHTDARSRSCTLRLIDEGRVLQDLVRRVETKLQHVVVGAIKIELVERDTKLDGEHRGMRLREDVEGATGIEIHWHLTGTIRTTSRLLLLT